MSRNSHGSLLHHLSSFLSTSPASVTLLLVTEHFYPASAMRCARSHQNTVRILRLSPAPAIS